MHRCSSGSHGDGVGGCSCGGMFSGSESSSFSMFFSGGGGNPCDMADPYAYSHVDCTLSLGTPSTRQTESTFQSRRASSSSYSPNLCWDIFQTTQPSSSTSPHKNARGGSSGSGGSLLHMGSDARLARRCANCDTTSTPLWRNGPRGPKSLCNACGIRYKKEERRATTSSAVGDAPHLMGQQNHHTQRHWGYAGQQLQMSPAPPTGSTDFRLAHEEDDDGDGESSQYLSWRLSVPLA